MRNLHYRIEALERAKCVQRDRHHGISERAMAWLLPDDVESLIAAYGADRLGRRHTAREAVSRRAYTAALARECRSAGVHSITDTEVDRTVVIRQGMIQVLARRLSPQELELCRSGLIGAQQDREPTEPELAAIETYRSEVERISLLAGFRSVTEFDTFRRGERLDEVAGRC